MTQILDTYAGRVGRELDVFLNVVALGGAPGETVSTHAAEAAVKGQRWACVLCRWLALTVETAHCPKTLAGATVSPRAGLLAAIQLFAVALTLSGTGWWLAFHAL